MRKGQIKLLERVRRDGYSDACIQLLSREDLTLKQLEQLSYDLVECRTQNDPKWIDEYVNLVRKPDIGRLVVFYVARHKDVSYDDLLRLQSPEQLCEFFSTDDVVCESPFDAEFMMRYGYNEHTPALLEIARQSSELYQEMYEDWWRVRGYWIRMDKIVERYSELSEYKELWETIDYDICFLEPPSYIEELIQRYFETHKPFNLKSSQGLPKEILEMDFHGYKTKIAVNGKSRFVKSSSKCLNFSVSPYYEVNVNGDGAFYVTVDHKRECRILYFYSGQRFVTEYNTRSGSRYRATTLRDLFQSISISEDDADNENAMSVIEYLCNRYETSIFKDLYTDYLQWNCILLPLTIEEAAAYHSKKELFQEHYHMPISGDWNKKNANLSYLILKLYKRLSAAGLARAMQCSHVPSDSIHIGKKRYKFACLLYSAAYQTAIYPLLDDSLREEYEMKQICLNPEAQTVNAHNARHRAGEIKRHIPTVRIKKDTRFKKLIDEMPQDFELIRTGKRIDKEAEMQHNCVRSYAQSISRDECMIYSVLYQGERHTIEIISNGGRYSVRQCLRACNRGSNPELAKRLASEIKRINRISERN